MRNKTNILHSLTVAAATLLFCCACGSELADGQETTENVPMRIELQSPVAADGGTSGEARLLFWRESDLEKIGVTDAGSEVTPYWSCIPEGEINDYTDEKYDTEQYYPTQNVQVYAVGFSPSTLKFEEGSNYGTIPLPQSDWNGVGSTVYTSNHIIGSGAYNFHNTLEFRHPTTRFVFHAKRSERMAGNLYVKGITIYFPKNRENQNKGKPPYFANILKWDTEEFCYKAAFDGTNEANYDAIVSSNHPRYQTIYYHGGQLSSENFTVLGTRYLIPFAPRTDNGNIRLEGLTINATYSFDIGFASFWSETYENVSIELKKKTDGDDQPVTETKPGETYHIYITFDWESFQIEAVQEDWENGGKIPVPIYPTD